MTDSFYLEQMGITAARRAFFSYTVTPQGSYGLHVIFRKFLKDKKIVMEEGSEERWTAFFTDYVVLRLYLARFVLQEYAREYTPLLHLFAGFDQVAAAFPQFLKDEAVPGRVMGDISLLPADLEKRYSPAELEKLHDSFDKIAREAETKHKDRQQAMKSFLHAAITTLYRRNEVNPNTPVVWFFEEEALAYAAYLADFYKGLIPDEFYETVHFRPYQRKKSEEHIRSAHWEVSAAIVLVAAMAAFAVLVLAGT